MPNWTKEQLDAINKSGTNIIVSAGAGSGKTAVLTERIEKKVRDGISIEHLLVLTFTNEAAREMKKRVREKIKDNKEQSLLLNSSYIGTFDSYALSLVKKYHHILNISSNVNIVEASIIMNVKEKILDEVLNEMYSLNSIEFSKLIKDFFVKDDKVLRKSLINIINKLDMKYDKITYLNNYLNEYYQEKNFNIFFTEYEKLLQLKILELKEALDNLTDYLESDYAIKFNDAFEKLFQSTNYDDIKNNTPLKLPILKNIEKSEELEIARKKVKDLLDEIKNLTISTKGELFYNLNSTKPYVKTIIEIILKLDQKINNYKSINDLYEFSDICKMSIRLLKENENIRLELKNYFHEIMIDEYQDTSDLQEEFINLISNNNLYMVGDIKQSIYKFRNANSYIFKNKYDNYSKLRNGIKIDLLKNFRSRSEVINNINLIFNQIMTDDMGGASYEIKHQMVFGNNSYIDNQISHDLEILNYQEDSNYTKSEIEAFIIAKDIQNKLKSYSVQEKDHFRQLKYDDIVILIDRASDFNLYKKIFLYFKIPLTMYIDETINNSDDILIIKNIINLIICLKNKDFNDSFKYSFLSIGRSYLTDYTDDELFKIIKNNKYFETSICQKINDILNTYDELTINEIIHLIIEKFDFYNNLIKVGNIDEALVRINYLTNISTSLANIGYTLNDFYQYLNETFKSNNLVKYSINKETRGSVKIMTIHKSKGLEFELCYYAGLSKAFNITDTKERFKYDNKYGFITPYFEEGIGNTFINEIYKEYYFKEELSERIRLFYVALTRSKGKMCLLCDFKDENNKITKYHSIKDMLINIKESLLPYVKQINNNELSLTKKYFDIKSTNYYDYIEPGHKIDVTPLNIITETIKEEKYSKDTSLITKEVKDKMQVGTIMHHALELIDFKDLDTIENLDINDFYKEKLKKFISLDILKNYQKIYKEYEFIYKNNNLTTHGIIDLMVEHDNHIDIIDYKLKNTKDEAYLNQLIGYKDYINKLTKKDINIYLYSIIDENLEKITT